MGLGKDNAELNKTTALADHVEQIAVFGGCCIGPFAGSLPHSTIGWVCCARLRRSSSGRCVDHWRDNGGRQVRRGIDCSIRSRGNLQKPKPNHRLSAKYPINAPPSATNTPKGAVRPADGCSNQALLANLQVADGTTKIVPTARRKATGSTIVDVTETVSVSVGHDVVDTTIETR